MRFFIALNETDADPHFDVHKALMKLTDEGIIDEYEVFPFLGRITGGEPPESVMHELVSRAVAFQPDGILWSHTVGLKVRKEDLQYITKKCTGAAFGYWDGDIYEAPYKKLPDEVIELATFCDVTFVQGFGQMTDTLRRSGAKHIEYVPGPTDEWRFGAAPKNSRNLSCDVVMIANSVKSRLPWRTMPGSIWRRELVSLLEKKLGSRFVVYGKGWNGPSAAGPIPFNQQLVAYHRGRVAVGVNNLHAQYYFSNRLAIAMSSGIPLVHNHEIGFERLFSRDFGPFFFRTTESAWSVLRNLLEKDQDTLDTLGAAAREYALTKFSITEVMRFISSVLRLCSSRKRQTKNDSLNVTNPWLGDYNSYAPLRKT